MVQHAAPQEMTAVEPGYCWCYKNLKHNVPGETGFQKKSDQLHMNAAFLSNQVDAVHAHVSPGFLPGPAFSQ